MAGFRLEPKQYKLTFEDPALSGLVVVMSGMSLGEGLDFDVLRWSKVTTQEEVRDWAKDVAAVLAEHLVEWNAVDKDGQPVPATVEGILSQDRDLMRAILPAYANALSAVPDPLDDASTNGSEVASLPTETLPSSP